MRHGPGGRRRRSLILVGAAWPWVPAVRAAEARHFPDRPVRIVVPYSVGIGPDVVARALAQQLAALWGQPVRVDNKPGASGIVAFAEVRQVPADGHTLFVADTATLAVNPLLHASLPYDPYQDLALLSLLFQATFVLWVGAGSRFSHIGALLQAAQRKPESVSFATLGNGHASHVAVETLARAAGVRLLHVPFREAGSLFTALASGDVDLTAFSHHSLAGLLASGRVRPLAVAARQRLRELPEVPTLAQAGAPAVDMHPWAALVTVAGTPAGVLARLQQDVAAALQAPALRQQAADAGFQITPSTPQALRQRIEADLALYRPLVAEGRVARF